MDKATRERLKAKASTQKEAKGAAPPVPPVASSAPKKGFSLIGYEAVTAKCGHPEECPVFQDPQGGTDPHLDQRRSRIAERNCGLCRKKAHDEQMAKDKESKRKRLAKSQKPGWQRQAKENLGRLPDGATFGPLVYSAETQTWTGQLAVNGTTYSGSASAVMRLLSELDRQYRADLGVPVEQGASS